MISYAARSHVGRIRENNEDNLYVDGVLLTPDIRERPFAIDGHVDGSAIFAVCDGMGGEESGETASMEAVQRLSHSDCAIMTARPKRLEEVVQSAVDDMNEWIRSAAMASNSRMGTTLALAVIIKNRAYCFSMGDSRIYALRKEGFRQITNDHTPDRSAGGRLTRCIGIGNVLTVESYPPVPAACRILICSDGLTDMLSDKEIESILRSSVKTENAADRLLDTALMQGGKDNVTLIVVDMKGSRLPFLSR